ncbi:MAG TPA: hypothetical protein VKB57_09910 [Acidimicrobiales bacterium]|nr:hypothetical protein [Acidimicrobiales bacterium]
MAGVTLYRGQKVWDEAMDISAPTLRSAYMPDVVAYTDTLLLLVDGLMARADGGDAAARRDLENKLLGMQQLSYENPYVSCSRSTSTARSFATGGDTPGYLLQITGDDQAGLDYEAVRTRHGLTRDSVKYLDEVGIPRKVAAPFTVVAVWLVDPTPGVADIEVYPGG